MNPLQKIHDKITQLFIDGKISKEDYLEYDKIYQKEKDSYEIDPN